MSISESIVWMSASMSSSVSLPMSLLTPTTHVLLLTPTTHFSKVELWELITESLTPTECSGL